MGERVGRLRSCLLGADRIGIRVRDTTEGESRSRRGTERTRKDSDETSSKHTGEPEDDVQAGWA